LVFDLSSVATRKGGMKGVSEMKTLETLRAGRLVGSTELRICADLEEFPREILDLADTLEILDLSGNRLSALPDDFCRLRKLRIVFFSLNRFEEFPQVLGKCPNLEMIGFKSCRIRKIDGDALPPRLRWLILTDNQLEDLPASIGDRPRLQKLMLAGNRLRSLPKELSNCRNLELLRISANQLDAFPTWLLDMPRLSWLAWSGNPFCTPTNSDIDLPPEIDWKSLELEEVLGSGASGVISKAHLSGTDKNRHVAVKVFKGTVTSDGYPADEMAACIAAGHHPNLVNVEGRVANHPEARHGLVLSLIPPHYRNLAGPPSYATCTRDVFPEGASFTAEQILSIVRGVASLCAHLHDRHVNHGDLYAHNILVDDHAHALAGDFGAASVLTGFDPSARLALQRLEVRAFGCLLDDLLRLLPASVPDSLGSLRDACLSETPASRPLFSEILSQLS
jgi:hypothetical protein